MVEDFKKRFWVCLVLTIPVLILSPMIQEFLRIGSLLRFRGDMYVLFILSSIIFFYGGVPFFKGLAGELKDKQPGMMTLIALAIILAYFYSTAVVFGLGGKIFFWELVTLIDIMLLGHWIEMNSVMGAEGALEDLANLLPAQAHRVGPDGSIKDTPLEELNPHDIVLIKPGEKIPADGVVIKGETSVNEAMLTGESLPVLKKIGNQVIGGSINSEGSITVKINKTKQDLFISRVIELVSEAKQSKSHTQDLANRAALWLTVVALVAGAITLFMWLLPMNKDFAFALERAVTVMVITCPHALGLAIPLVVAVSTAIAAKNGLLIRNRVAFEKARNIQAVIFDKTGTLTEGKFAVTSVIPLSKDTDENEILKLAASLESYSEHSIAKAIVSSSKEIIPVDGFRAIPGEGIEGRIYGRQAKVVSRSYLNQKNISVSEDLAKKISSQGNTSVFLLLDGEPKGAITLSDIIRPESQKAITLLKKMGIKCMMLTGDNKQVAMQVASQLGLDEYFAEVLPGEKVAKIKQVQQRGLVVAMVGDGINDAPALAQADVGIAIGAGTDVAVNTADIILVKNNPLDAVKIIGLAKATYRKMVENLLWATGYNAFAIPLAAGVLYKPGIILSPALGALLMSLSTIIVAINARFLRLSLA